MSEELDTAPGLIVEPAHQMKEPPQDQDVDMAAGKAVPS
jgi:hypothetical protein